MIPPLIALAAFAPMIAEALLSARHDAVLRARGAVEPPGDVFRIMQLAYPTAFGVIAVEAWLRRVEPDAWVAAGAALFVLAKTLKYWAIATLGERWTFRVLVPPDAPRITRGPYRVLRHPNYVAVVGELVGAALAGHALVTGPLVTLGFGLLILRRIHIEEHALATPS